MFYSHFYFTGSKSWDLLSSGKWFPLSWRRGPAPCSGSAGSTPSPSASAATLPGKDCTLGTYAPDGPVYKLLTNLHRQFKVHRLEQFIDRETDIWPDSSRRPEPGHWCPALCLVATLPAPWLCTPRRATAPSSRCPASQRAQRSRPGSWPESGWTRRTRASHRRRESRLWPRRSRSAWCGTLGSYTGVCHRRGTWLRIVEDRHIGKGIQLAFQSTCNCVISIWLNLGNQNHYIWDWK